MLPLYARSAFFSLALLISLLVFGWGSAAHAGLAGQSLDAGYYLPDTVTPYGPAVFTPSSFVVGPGLETIADVEGVTNLLIDFSDTSLTITLETVLATPTWNAASFSGLIFDSVAPLGIAAATVNASTTMAGFDDSRVTFNANQILVNWQGLSYVDGTELTIDFGFVPEPGTALLLGLGLAGLASRRESA